METPKLTVDGNLLLINATSVEAIYRWLLKNAFSIKYIPANDTEPETLELDYIYLHLKVENYKGGEYVMSLIYRGMNLCNRMGNVGDRINLKKNYDELVSTITKDEDVLLGDDSKYIRYIPFIDVTDRGVIIGVSLYRYKNDKETGLIKSWTTTLF